MYIIFKQRILYSEINKKSPQLDLISKFLNDEFYRNVPKSHYNFVLNYFNARSAVDTPTY